MERERFEEVWTESKLRNVNKVSIDKLSERMELSEGI